MTDLDAIPPSRSESTDLERRVLAHERILQSLIAYMARTEPRFVDHLRGRFVDPMHMAQREHDHRETDDYAEEFIRAVMLLGDAHVAEPPKATGEQVSRPDGTGKGRPYTDHLAVPARVQVRERSGIWEVRADGKFRGDYHQKEHALAAAALLKLSPG
jgi:hypothetical protein